MMIGGRSLLTLSDRSRLGEESRDDGLEENDRGEMERAWRPQLPSSKEKEEKCVYFKNFFFLQKRGFIHLKQNHDINIKSTNPLSRYEENHHFL